MIAVTKLNHFAVPSETRPNGKSRTSWSYCIDKYIRNFGLIAVLCGWDAQPVGFVVWRIGESRSSGRCETLSFSKRR